ncbi:hypothetical protein TTHERM_00079290 (macronuclear) [Tetrahymena thermophila SB210]|uniref:Transmembrane protein n=1 Tax=Tetrahymena thermophila (strain SB210) TaxID=312017 RepID=Q23FT5_TETTS|nr:hypothetical protein TTHERM_00079290 [Tetrahymena thermophila SB210]EAR95525.2 hypothetical protein TTHERM_00079290 [Tetrahymena thermophila SB210]|eukprot:XP_001015770.2 hypothetical protein TTHERM_00079290 [Tetrahymena thermophila SB210]
MLSFYLIVFLMIIQYFMHQNCRTLAKDEMFKLIIAIEQDTLKLQNELVETQRQQEHFMKQRIRFAETSRKYYKYKDYSKQLEKQVENLLNLIPNQQPSINIQSNINTLREYIQFCQNQQDTNQFLRFINQYQGYSQQVQENSAKYQRNQYEIQFKNTNLSVDNKQRHILINKDQIKENEIHQIKQDKILIVDGGQSNQSRSDNLFDLKELSKELNQQQFFLNTNQYTHERIQNNNIFHKIEANLPTQKILTQSLKLDELASTVKQIPKIVKENNNQQNVQINNLQQNEQGVLKFQLKKSNIEELNLNLLQIQIDVAKEQYLEKSKQYNDLKCQVQNLDLLKQDMEKVCSNNLHQTQIYVQFYRKSLACMKLVVFMNQKITNQILSHSFIKLQKENNCQSHKQI